ncbi:MAG: T9SS type A sorting domain-containing protein [Bacteroidota bacterium]
MKKIIILTVIFLVSVNVVGQFFSQQLVCSGGDQSDNATYQTSWSIGEPITETATAGAYMLTQGFQQTLYPPLVAGTIAASQSICYNTAPAQLTSTPPTGGNTPYTYQWQNSPNGATWTNITGATSQNYQPPALAATTWYRLNQTSASGSGTVTTNSVTITVYPNLVAGTIAGNQTICANTAPALLTGTAPTGGTTPYTYQWQSSPNGTTWTNIAGATALTYQPPVLTATTWYRLNQTSASGCGTVPTNTVTITVNPLPVPTITGPASVCIYSSGNVYTTQTGMTNYIWTVSAGGTISGGTGTNAITVTWTTSGAETVSVIYTNSNGCTANPVTVYNVTVNPLPIPTINSYNPEPCVGSTGNQFYTETGMTNYVWTITSGGVITAGQGTSNITVTWILTGLQTITVIYTNANGCTAVTPGIYMTVVNPFPNPAGPITGPAAVCAGTNGVAYSTGLVANATSYTWTLPPGASIATGAGTNSITVNYSATATSGNITVAGTNQCGNGPSSSLAVTVNPLPAPAGTITGTSPVCQGATGVIYSVPTITSATGYVWTVPPGATIVGGNNTKQITVNFSLTATSGNVTVYGTNSCGNGTISPPFNVTVNPKPAAPVITLLGDTLLSSSAPSGNQWYFNGTAIPGATGQTYLPTESGDYYVIVTIDGCSSDPSNTIYVIITGIPASSITSSFNLYPVPNDGQFIASIVWPKDETFTIAVYNIMGVQIYETRVFVYHGKAEKFIDLRPAPNGVYTVVFYNSDHRMIRRILVNK